jgi:hypothetical protein
MAEEPQNMLLSRLMVSLIGTLVNSDTISKLWSGTERTECAMVWRAADMTTQ